MTDHLDDWKLALKERGEARAEVERMRANHALTVKTYGARIRKVADERDEARAERDRLTSSLWDAREDIKLLVMERDAADEAFNNLQFVNSCLRAALGELADGARAHDDAGDLRAWARSILPTPGESKCGPTAEGCNCNRIGGPCLTTPKEDV